MGRCLSRYSLRRPSMRCHFAQVYVSARPGGTGRAADGLIKREADMPDNENKPDYAPRNYQIPKLDFSDANLDTTPTETKTKTYTVDSGDNLSAIAHQEHGRANRWRESDELNTDVTGNNREL